MNLGSLSKRNQTLLFILIPITTLILFYVFYLAGSFDAISNLKKQNESLKSEIDKANKLALKAEELKSQIRELQKEKEHLMNLLPKEEEINDLVKDFYKMSLIKGLKIETWKPFNKSLHYSGEVYELPIFIKMRGNYHSLLSLFAEIEKFQRIINMDKFWIFRGNIDDKGFLIRGADPSNLRISLLIKTYFFISEEEKKKLAEQIKKDDKDKK